MGGGVRVVGLLVVLLAALGPRPARAAVTLQIVEADPPSPAVLGHWEQHHVLVSYETDRPIRLRGDTFLQDRRVTSITGGSPRLEAGMGEAMFWFAYTAPAQVDRIVVWAEDAATGASLAQVAVGVDLTWTGAPPVQVARPRQEWVERLKAAQTARLKAETDAYMSRATPWWQTLLVFGMVWSAPGYLVVQGVALWRLRGGWRVAAAIPLVPMASSSTPSSRSARVATSFPWC